jgi:CDP-glycerol glycerophosphotransferase (TagB/SpsB family)
MYRMFGLDYFDSVLLTGDYQAKDIRTLETLRGLPQKHLVTVGCTYLDRFSEKIKAIPEEDNPPFTVLVSPSWGPSALLAKQGEKLLDPLVKTGWRIILRPHPQSKKSEAAILERLTRKYQDVPTLEWDYENENIYSLHRADIMISDFSGIIYDYTFLRDKPVIYVKQGFDLTPYDADDLDYNASEELWQFRILKEIGIELREEFFVNIAAVIQDAVDNPKLREARRRAKDEAWQHRGEAGKLAADFMIKKDLL